MVHIGADINAADMGIGFMDLKPLNMGFVLSRFGLSINRMPVYDEWVDIRTWPASIERGAFIRKGEMLDASGKKLMEWTSMWVLFDTQTRRILRPSALPVAIEAMGDLGVATNAEKVDLSVDLGEEVSSYTHTVRYCEVDTNLHMNNSMYGDMIGNVLYMDEKNASTHWKSVQINYLAEARINEQIQVTCHSKGNTFTVIGKSGDKTVFAAEVTV
jgi:acyl-ACP thioesterase